MRSMLSKVNGVCASAVARRFASSSKTTTGVRFAAVGNPAEVLKYEKEVPVGNMGADDVTVKILQAPINPADLNFVEGIYGHKAASFPCVPGGEGLAEVTHVGSNVKNLKVGDWVIPGVTGFGMWRSEAVSPASDWLPVPNDIPRPYAATLLVNPCTSYRLLEDFVDLKEGDWLIQNCANSMVGLGVIQMARERGIKTINVVRSDRPDHRRTMHMLTNYGADVTIEDSYLNTHSFQKMLADIPGGVKLGLNAVGGDAAVHLARALGHNATLVTYGAMSRKPVSMPFDLVANKQLKLKGFWMAAWHAANATSPKRTEMINNIAAMIREKQLEYLYELHDFDDFEYALQRANEPYMLRKVILNMDYPDRFAEHDALPQEFYNKFQLPVDVF